MIKNVQEIIRQKVDKGLNTYKNFFNLSEGQTPASINVVYNNDGSFGKRLGSSTMNTTVLESTAGYGMYDFGVLGVGGNDSNTNLLLHFDGTPLVDSSRRVYTITTYGDFITSPLQSKFGGVSGLFATNPELDYMEYASDALAQAAYVSSSISSIAVSYTIHDNGEWVIYGAPGTFEMWGQSFQVPSTITCNKVELKLLKANSPTDNSVVRIETQSAGQPSGTLVDANATKSVAASGLPSPAADWVTYTFPGTFTLTSGITYWIVLSRDGARDATNYFLWAAGLSSLTYDSSRKSSGSWATEANNEFNFRVYGEELQCYSEATIKTQGSYSLKGVAAITNSLTDTLIRTTTSPTLSLIGANTISFGIYSNRTGSNIKLGFRNTGGALTTFETAPFINSANTWETKNWDISGVVNNSKNSIDRIIWTIIDATTGNTFYIDNLYAGNYKIINTGAFISVPDNVDWNTGLGNFTIDNQINFNYVSTSQALIGQGSNATNYWHLIYNTAAVNTVNGLYFQVYSAGVLTVNLSGIWSPNTSSFYHLELVRNTTNNWYMFMNGSNIFVSGTTAGIVPDFASLLKLGVNVVTTNNAYLHAFADEWRFSNNARHTSTFTPPTVAYHSDIVQERRLLCASGTGIYYSTVRRWQRM